ncbi:MAG: STAS domain-containing protein [Clostridia bacterium]|nr:STAS domain-containing protein [Clostridia bacterium]
MFKQRKSFDAFAARANRRQQRANTRGLSARCDRGRKARKSFFDAKKPESISSTGLRILLRLRKEFPELRITNVCPEVYEIFEMAGFAEMMSVEKAFRR